MSVQRAVGHERAQPNLARKVVAGLHAQAVALPLNRVGAVGVVKGPKLHRTCDDVPRADQHGKPLEKLVLRHGLNGVHHPVRAFRPAGNWLRAQVLPRGFEDFVRTFGEAHVASTGPHGIGPTCCLFEVVVDDGLVAVNPHPTFAKADVRQVFFTGQHPAARVEFVRLAPRVIPDEVDVGAFADFGLHVPQSKAQGVDPHLPFESQFATTPWHEGHMETRPPPAVQGVQDVIAVVHVAAVV